MQAYMSPRHATCSITSRHSYASKSQGSTVKSVQMLISSGACSIMFTTNIAHGVRGYHSKCSDEIAIVGTIWRELCNLVCIFFFCRVMYCLLSIVVRFFFGVSVVLLLFFLLTPCSSDRDGIFHFQDILFSSALVCIVERVKLCHPKVRVMSQYGGQKRDLILEPVSGPISASLEGASIVSPKGPAGLLAGLSLIY